MLKRDDALKREQLELEEASQTALTPEQMREKLINQATEDTQTVKLLEKKLKQTKEAIDKNIEDLKNKSSTAKQLGSQAAALKKDENAVEKSRKIDEFLDRFPSEQEKMIEEKKILQMNVVNLLEFLSKNIVNEQNINAEANPTLLADMKDELKFKQEQTQNSEVTLTKLHKELEKRQEELDKISNLDSKLAVEFSALTERISQMEADSIVYQNVDGLKSKFGDIRTVYHFYFYILYIESYARKAAC